ncbi:MAG: hypothetical protein FJ202_05715 [Gemmatimonadetes bacterium]|nr:hypothetical protein [Gemmatimonadota bacterium]
MRFALVFSLWTHQGPSAPPRDAWFARDKLLHFTASALVQGAAHSALRANGRTYGEASRGAALATVTVGIGKEVWDRFRGGDPSAKDLAWDAVGGLSAGVVVRQVDR